jgi:hypothetical protein
MSLQALVDVQYTAVAIFMNTPLGNTVPRVKKFFWAKHQMLLAFLGYTP